MSYSTNKNVIAAICGNFYQESGVNPGVYELYIDNGYGFGGYGLGQWTNSRTDPSVRRKTALFNWLTQYGYQRDSGEGQLQFLIQENSWLPYITSGGNTYTSNYTSLTDFLSSTSTNLEDLTYEFFHFWEGIDDGTGPTRYYNAQQFYSDFQNPPTTRNPWAARNSYLTQSEIENNAYLIMDFFIDSPPTPTPVQKHSRLKPWMIYYLS